MSSLSSIVRATRSAFAPPHAEAAPFLGVALIGMLAGLVYGIAAVVALAVAFGLFCLYFFRDPRRVPPDRPGAMLAPADGIVTEVALAVPPPELGLEPVPMRRIATFLSVLDVHVNRMPADATVERVAYRKGRFLNASLDKASDENERNALVLRLGGGERIVVVQIAGLIARRIVCKVAAGDARRAGERFGLIRFGSRTDLYLPDDAAVLVRPGQTMVGGETVMATLAVRPAMPAGTAAGSVGEPGAIGVDDDAVTAGLLPGELA